MTTKNKLDRERQKKIQKAQGLIDQGKTYREVGARVKVSGKTITYWVGKGLLEPYRGTAGSVQEAAEAPGAQDAPEPAVAQKWAWDRERQTWEKRSAEPGAVDPLKPEAATVIAVEELGGFERPAHDLPGDLNANIIYQKFSKNGKLSKKMVKAAIVTDKPYRAWDFYKIPLVDVLKAGIYPARHGNGWVYPVVIRDGKWENWPRVPVTVRTSSQALYWFRHWPEWNSILSNISEMWGRILTGGIIAVICLTLVVIFLLLFFGFIG